ncbi:MAG: HAMP domain-containing sensor histidine kinase [Longimicrobiales bacterium]|nr:HAMP domain-containing sensor histidine kinase [Longimicrobiales bacterium]
MNPAGADVDVEPVRPPPTDGGREGEPESADPQGLVATLRAAVERVREGLAGRDDVATPDGVTADQLLDAVHRDLQGRLAGREPDGLEDVVEAPGRLRLVQLLQSELIHVWSRRTSDAPGREEILAVLSHLDQIRVSLEPHGRDRVVALMESESPLTLVVQLAHDLRSPLTSILFLAELLQRGRSGPVNETQQRQLGVVYSAAFALVAIANDVIALARGGGTVLSQEAPVPFSLTECLGQIREMLQPMAEDKGVEIRVVTPRDDRRVGPPGAIGRALLNLATNALKFTEEGFVEVAAESAGWEEVCFSVTDTGRGMSPDAERNLLQPFQKSERRKGVFFSGSGLGLSIVRRIVHDLGGTLEYRTRLNHGTRFHFTLRLPPVQDIPG